MSINVNSEKKTVILCFDFFFLFIKTIVGKFTKMEKVLKVKEDLKYIDLSKYGKLGNEIWDILETYYNKRLDSKEDQAKFCNDITYILNNKNISFNDRLFVLNQSLFSTRNLGEICF